MDEMLKKIVECIGPRHGAKKELAEYLDIHPNVITNWLNGRNKSYRKYLPQIAAYYNKPLDYFLGNESESRSDTSTAPARKLRSISRLEDCEITPEQDEEISNYIDYLLSKRGKE